MNRFVVSYEGAPEFGLKKPVLWVDDDQGTMTKIASFNNKVTAAKFITVLSEELVRAAKDGSKSRKVEEDEK